MCFIIFRPLCQTQAKLATLRLREMLIKKCLGFGKSFYDKYTFAYLQQILTTSTDLIELRCKIFQEFISEFLLMVCYLFIMLMVSWKLTLAIALIFPVLALMTAKAIRKIRTAATERHKRTLIINERILNMLYCLPIIKSFSKRALSWKSFQKTVRKKLSSPFICRSCLVWWPC